MSTTLELLGLALVGVAFGLIVLVFVLLSARRKTVVRRLECPVTQEPVVCRLVRGTTSERWMKVTDCTAVNDPARDCDRVCLDGLNSGNLEPDPPLFVVRANGTEP